MATISGDLMRLSTSLIDDMQAFAEFVEADTVEFKDLGNGETLTITKNGKTFTIKACGNRFDGGFFGYDPPPCPSCGRRS